MAFSGIFGTAVEMVYTHCFLYKSVKNADTNKYIIMNIFLNM